MIRSPSEPPVAWASTWADVFWPAPAFAEQLLPAVHTAASSTMLKLADSSPLAVVPTDEEPAVGVAVAIRL